MKVTCCGSREDVTGLASSSSKPRGQNWNLFPRSETADAELSSSFSRWSHTRNCDTIMLNRRTMLIWLNRGGDVSRAPSSNPRRKPVCGRRPLYLFYFVDPSVLRGAPPLTCLNRVKLFICTYMYNLYIKFIVLVEECLSCLTSFSRFFNASANSLIEIVSSGLCFLYPFRWSMDPIISVKCAGITKFQLRVYSHQNKSGSESEIDQ